MRAARASIAALLHVAAAAAAQPHIVVLLADDLGWAGVSWNNPEVQTPHLEELRAGGVVIRRAGRGVQEHPVRGSLHDQYLEHASRKPVPLSPRMLQPQPPALPPHLRSWTPASSATRSGTPCTPLDGGSRANTPRDANNRPPSNASSLDLRLDVARVLGRTNPVDDDAPDARHVEA